MPGFLDALTEEQRWAITDFIVSLSGAAVRLHQPRCRQARGGSDRSREGGRELRVRAGGALSNRRTDHGARARVPSACDVRDRSGRLRCRVDRHPRPVARHERADRPARTARRFRCRRRRSRHPPPAGAPRRPTASGGCRRHAGPRQDPFADPGGRGRDGRASEFSDAVAIQLPSQVPTGARKPYFIFGDGQKSGGPLVLRSGSLRSRSSSPGGAARTSRPTTRGISPASRATTRANGRSSSSAPCARPPGAPFTPGKFVPVAFSVWDGFSRERGNRRGLTTWYSLYVEPKDVPSAVGPMVRTAFVILAIELIVIGWVRRRYGSRAPEEAARRASRGGPAATERA
jgi:hypothetical protein